MRKTLVSLGATAAAGATALMLATAASAPNAEDETDTATVCKTGRGENSCIAELDFDLVSARPANDKEAHVPIWFTLSLGGAEAPTLFREFSSD
jgi:hypothetical protein